MVAFPKYFNMDEHKTFHGNLLQSCQAIKSTLQFLSVGACRGTRCRADCTNVRAGHNHAAPLHAVRCQMFRSRDTRDLGLHHVIRLMAVARHYGNCYEKDVEAARSNMP
eukprot:1884605-Amphidinium_carterae.1